VEREAQVKGYTLLSYITPLQNEKSALWAEIEKRLEPRSRDFYQQPIFANNWYPRRHLHALMTAFCDATSRRAEELRELGSMAARYQLHVIYRLFLKFVTPAMVFGRAASVWSRQTTVGSFRVVSSAADNLVGELEDPELPEGIPDLMSGWSDTIIAMLGKTPYPTRWEKIGPRRWRFFVRWVS
jgi:hypothetical protein